MKPIRNGLVFWDRLGYDWLSDQRLIPKGQKRAERSDTNYNVTFT